MNYLDPNKESLNEKKEPEKGLPEVSEQIYYKERKFHKSLSSKNRQSEISHATLFGPEAENESYPNKLVISSGVNEFLRLNEPVSLEKVAEMLEKEGSDDRVFEFFVDNLIVVNNLDNSLREKMLKDDDFKKKFLRLVYFGGEYNEIKELASDARSFIDSVDDFADLQGKKDGLSKSLEESRKRRWFSKVNSRIVKNPKVGNLFIGAQKEAYLEWKRGHYSRDDYHNQLTKIYAEAVEKSDDEELKNMWLSEQSSNYDTTFYTNLFASENTSSFDEVPVSQSDIDVVNANVSSVAGISEFGEIFFDDFGFAKVDTGHCSIGLSVFKKTDNGDFVYYLEDDFSNSGRIGPISSARDLPEIIDDRQIDAFLTKSIVNPVFQREFSKIPDDKLTVLAKRLVGAGGSERNFKINADCEKILKNLLGFLQSDSGKESLGLNKKIDKLSLYTSKKANADGLRDVFLRGETFSYGSRP